MRRFDPEGTIQSLAFRLLAGIFSLFFPALAMAHDTLDFNAVQGILSANCGGGGCHINQATSGVNLTSYETLMNSVGVNTAVLSSFPETPRKVRSSTRS